tara:strand:- start:63 stop:230 length:168 start_codon:yes stop_codon:yes gene_type:complete
MVSEVVDKILRMDAAELKRSVVPPSLLHDGPIKEAVVARLAQLEAEHTMNKGKGL